MIKTTVQGADRAAEALRKALAEFMTGRRVTVGIHEDDNARASGEMTNAKLGAIQEYGADIDHPGGTSYGYKTQKDAEKGKVSFMASGQGFMELGKTQAHKITIPARPWLEPGVKSGNLEYLRIIRDALEDGEDLEQALERVGVVAVAKVQQYMTQLKSPANAPSTIRKKGSSNPLIDTGILRSSVDYKVE